MKLRNRKTGEIRNAEDVIIENLKKNGSTLNAINIDEIREEWEDAEEPKASIHVTGPVEKNDNTVLIEFYTHEEAEKATKRLRAWKRLKDKKFKFRKWRTADIGGDKYYFVMQAEADDAEKGDLDLLFGGEE